MEIKMPMYASAQNKPLQDFLRCHLLIDDRNRLECPLAPGVLTFASPPFALTIVSSLYINTHYSSLWNVSTPCKYGKSSAYIFCVYVYVHWKCFLVWVVGLILNSVSLLNLWKNHLISKKDSCFFSRNSCWFFAWSFSSQGLCVMLAVTLDQPANTVRMADI